MTYREEVLIEFGEWVKTQPIYVVGGTANREIVVIRNGKFESAIEVYLEEKKEKEEFELEVDSKIASIPYSLNKVFCTDDCSLCSKAYYCDIGRKKE